MRPFFKVRPGAVAYLALAQGHRALFFLPFGIKKHKTRGVWYDNGSLLVASFLVVAIRAIINLKQSRQFDKLSKVKTNIQIDAVRAGRRQKISIFEIVVGDVIYNIN